MLQSLRTRGVSACLFAWEASCLLARQLAHAPTLLQAEPCHARGHEGDGPKLLPLFARGNPTVLTHNRSCFTSFVTLERNQRRRRLLECIPVPISGHRASPTPVSR